MPSAISSAAKVRAIGAYRVASKKTDNQAETNCTERKRNLGVFHGDLQINPQSG
jgi:hypothetical protein